MDYRLLLQEENKLIRERYELASERISEIAMGEQGSMPEETAYYFCSVAQFIADNCRLYEEVREDRFFSRTLQQMQEENTRYFEDIMPEQYENSYANPAFAVRVLGEEFGRILCFLYTELRSLRVFVFEQNLTKMTILMELFLEIYFLFATDDVSYKQVRDTIYWFFHDYADVWISWRVRELVDPTLDHAVSIIMDSDLNDPSYLYLYGEYISEKELAMADFMSRLPDSMIDEVAETFCRGYEKGFIQKNVDLSKKKTVDIRYSIGYERIIRKAIEKFREMGLEPVVFRSAYNILNKKQNHRIGYISSNPNEQYDYDHRYDEAIYLDRRMVDRKIACMKKAYDDYADLAAGYAGPACFEVFGEEPFYPGVKEEAYRLSERQQNLTVEYTSLASEVVKSYINQKERSFTIIAYPIPAIGDQFEDIFKDIHEVNTLDYDKYCAIQDEMIKVLDQAEAVKIVGRGKNRTNLTIRLCELTDPKTQTKFENCLADVNIPVGEVFTTPVLTGTNGVFHVTESFLEGICYKDLMITLEDGMITGYSCGNFEDEEQGKAFIKENLLYNRETLPVGEFAIGTNTTAYVVSSRYDIMDKLPILIAEKMGPHLAFGDTCYSYEEEVRLYNPNGKEIIAKDNECSVLRTEDLKKAYFNCHTDITIPYEELDRIVAVTHDRVEIPIILNGRFVLEGTWELNEPFMKE